MVKASYVAPPRCLDLGRASTRLDGNMLALDPLVIDGEEWLVISYTPPHPAAIAVLTGSEHVVIDRWRAGLTMRAIAAERGVTQRTIAKQIASAYRKLGVSSRAELIAVLSALDGR